MAEAKTRELYVIVDDNPETIAAVTAEVRRMQGVWSVGSVPMTANDAMLEAYGEYQKLSEMAQGDRVLVSPEALQRAQLLVTMAAQAAQAESLGKLVKALSDENVDYWISRIVRELGATR